MGVPAVDTSCKGLRERPLLLAWGGRRSERKGREAEDGSIAHAGPRPWLLVGPSRRGRAAQAWDNLWGPGQPAPALGPALEFLPQLVAGVGVPGLLWGLTVPLCSSPLLPFWLWGQQPPPGFEVAVAMHVCASFCSYLTCLRRLGPGHAPHSSLTSMLAFMSESRSKDLRQLPMA